MLAKGLTACNKIETPSGLLFSYEPKVAAPLLKDALGHLLINDCAPRMAGWVGRSLAKHRPSNSALRILLCFVGPRDPGIILGILRDYAGQAAIILNYPTVNVLSLKVGS